MGGGEPSSNSPRIGGRIAGSRIYNLRMKFKMAIPIREIPILTGQSAVDFINAADAMANVPVPHLSDAEEQRLRQMDEAHKSFVW